MSITVAAVVAWNPKVGHRRTFRNELASLPPASAYAFNECGGHWDDLDHWARRQGSTVLTGTGDIGSNSALILGPDVKVIRWGVEIVDVPWRGPKGKRIEGRSIVWALVEIDGVPLFLVVDHGPWNPVLNWRAWRAYQQRLRRMGTWFPSVDLLLVGDHNQPWSTRIAWAIRGTANKIRARYIASGSPLDYGIFRSGTKPRWLRVTARKGVRLFSDHAYIVYRLVTR